LVQVLSTDLKGNDKFWFPSLKAPKFDLPKSKGLEKQYTQENTYFYRMILYFSMASCPTTFFLPKKEQEMTFGSNPHLCYFSGSSHRGEHEVLQVNLLQ